MLVRALHRPIINHNLIAASGSAEPSGRWRL